MMIRTTSKIVAMKNVRISVFAVSEVFLFILIFLSLNLLNCSKKSSEPTTDSPVQYEYYPMAVGYKWIYGYYNYYDSLLTTDTTRIIGDTLINSSSGSYDVFIVEKTSGCRYFAYVTESERIHFSGDSGDIESILKFPFFDGRIDTIIVPQTPSEYDYIIMFDPLKIIKVVGNESITTVTGITFDDCWIVEITNINQYPAYGTPKYWYARDVGLVKIDYMFYRWEIIDYNFQ